MNHLEFAKLESDALNASLPEQWFSRLEKILGFSLDGDEKTDGYSLDGAYDLYLEGKTPLQASHIILWRKHGLHRVSA